MWLIALLPIIGKVVIASSNGFKSNTRYEYEISTRILTGLSDVSSEYNGVFYKAKLTLQAKSDGTSLIGHISDPRVFETFSQDLNSPIPSANYTRLTRSSKPFEVVMENGIVKELIVDKCISIYEINTLKGIISQLQIDLQGVNLMESSITQLPEHGRNSGVFKTMETTVSGTFETLYDINPLPEYKLQTEPYLVPLMHVESNGDIIEIVKTKNFSNAVQYFGFHYGVADIGQDEPLSNKLGDLVSRHSISRIVITGSLQRYTIQSLVTTNKIAVSPMLMNNNKKGLVVSVINLTLSDMQETLEQLQGPLNSISLDNLIYSYKHPFLDDNCTQDYIKYRMCNSSYGYDFDEQYYYSSNFINSSECKGDTFVGQEQVDLSEPLNLPLMPFYDGYKRQPNKINPEINTVKSAVKIALEIGNEIQNPDEISKENTLSKYMILSRLIRTMSLNEIKKVVKQVYSKEDHTSKGQAWKAFRDALAEAGTGPAFLAIKNLITDGKIENEEAAEVVSGLAQSVYEPTFEFIKSFYDFIVSSKIMAHSKLNVTSLLLFSELVNNVYVNKYYSHNQYPTNSFGNFYTEEGHRFVLEEYIPFLSENLNCAVDEGDSHKIQVYISALGNVGHPKILQVFKLYLEGKRKISQYLRLHIVNSLESLVRNYPSVARRVLYKIYQNSGEYSDIRVAAVYQLARTGPSPTMLQRMAEYSNIDKDDQVNAAVQSVIWHTAYLKGSQYGHKNVNAKSAKPFLPNRYYGPQYAHSYKKSFPGHEKTTFQYIASEDNYLPKAIRLAYRSNYGGFSRQYFSILAATSSLKHLFLELNNYIEQQNFESSESLNYRFSAKSIIQMLNISVNEQEKLEGSVLFKLGDYKRLLTVDKDTLEALPDFIKTIQQILREGKRFHFTKFLNADRIVISFPTDVGLPFLYTYNNPTVLSFGGTARIRADPEILNGFRLRWPKIINSELDVHLLFSHKSQGQFGFVIPSDHKHYFVGYEKAIQIYVPIKHKAYINTMHREIKTEFGFREPTKDIKIFNYVSMPYAGCYNIQDVTSILNSARLIGSLPKSYYNSNFGGQASGMIFRIEYEGEDKMLDPDYLYEQFKQHNYPGIISLWSNQDIGNRRVALVYKGEISSNRKIKTNSVCYTKSYDAMKQQKMNEKLFYNQAKEIIPRIKEFVKQIAAGITEAKIFGLGLDVAFEGNRSMEYKATFTYARSDVHPISRAILHSDAQIKNQEIKNYCVFSWIQNQTQSTSEMSVDEVLQGAIFSTSTGYFAIGQDNNSADSVMVHLNASRSTERIKHLRESKMFKQCRGKVQERSMQMYACENLIKEAKRLDNLSLRVKQNNNTSGVKSLAERVYNWFRYQRLIGYENYDHLTSLPDDFYAEIVFCPDFTRLNTTVAIKKHGSYKQIETYDFKKIYETPFIYWLSGQFTEIYIRPSCIADVNAVGTFDGFTYPVNFSNLWTVLLLYIPPQGLEAEPYNNYAIITRQTALNHKEVKVYLKTMQTQRNSIVIDLKMDGDKMNVYINRKQQNFSSNQINSFFNGYIELYLLHRSEIKLNIKGEFNVIYDGYRVKILLNNNRFYNDIRGLCGNSNSKNFDEFRTPENCAVRTSNELVEAYSIPDNVTPNNPKTNHYKYGCYNYNHIFANVVSNEDLRIDSKSEHGYHKGNCTGMRTHYKVEVNQVCFTTATLPYCQLGCKATKKIFTYVQVYCIEESKISDMWIGQINKGASPDFALKSPTKQVLFSIPQLCLELN